MTGRSDAWSIYVLHEHGSKDFRYVGLTTKPLETRLAAHRKNARIPSTPVYWWMSSRVVSISLLESCPVGDAAYLNFREQFWIAALREAGYRLLNLSDGGGGRQGTTHSLESRKKMSVARMGHTPSELTVSKFRERAMARTGEKNPLYGNTLLAITRSHRIHHSVVGTPLCYVCRTDGTPTSKPTASQLAKARYKHRTRHEYSEYCVFCTGDFK